MSSKKMVNNEPTIEEMDKGKSADERPMPLTLKSLITMGALVIGSYGWLLNSLNDLKQDINDIKSEKKGDIRVQELQFQELKNEVREQGVRINILDQKYQVMLESKIKP